MIQECSVAAAAAANTSRWPKFFKLTEAGWGSDFRTSQSFHYLFLNRVTHNSPSLFFYQLLPTPYSTFSVLNRLSRFV